MVASSIPVLHSRRAVAAAAIIALGGALTIATVYFYQYVLGYQPCPLCLEQRNAYYVSIPLAALLWLGAENRTSHKVILVGFAMIALVMVWNTGLSAFHAGVEWKFWPGPIECSGPANSFGSALSLRETLQGGVHIPRCDEAAWRFLGISFAGYDVVVSLVLAVVALWGAKAALAHHRRSH
jgi:disulfide bond formation protein DsbB